MRTFNYLFLALGLLISMKTYSQKTTLTLDELLPGGKNYYKYVPEMPYQLKWYGDKLTYSKADSIMVANTTGATPEVFLTLKEINDILDASQNKPLKSIRKITGANDGGVEFYMLADDDKRYVIDCTTKEITGRYLGLKGGANFDLEKNTKSIAYTRDNNLYVQNRDSKEIQITTETDKAIVCGTTVHREEFGITKGTFWSPQGSLLAFYRMDQTMVTDYPLVDISARVAKLGDIKYPMAGMKSHHVTVGVYDVAQGRTIYLKTGTPKEKYLTNIAWSLDEKYIYIAELNRGQDTCMLKSYDAATGKLHATLFTETHPKYVEPQNPILFLKNDPTKFIWQSRRDGFNHLYLYSTDGKLLKQLTVGNWEVTTVIGFDAKGDNLFYTSTEVSPIENHIYKLNMKNGKREQLSAEQGVHHAMLSASGMYIADIFTSQYNPGKVAIINTKTAKSAVFYEAKNPFVHASLPDITLGTLKANDGKTDLHYRMVKPSDFDPTQKYPAIVYTYGGPHLQLVTNSWMAQVRGWDIYMAQKGYIVFTLDNRGTPNRGLDFENIIHRQAGVVETQDQMAGVAFLKAQPYIDADRMGVHGWSYGGFMTLNLMLRHPETFKVGVAGGAVTDWKYYEIMYGERYMDSPQENPEGYKNSNMVDRAGDLKGRLMLIHGDEDPTVVMQQSMQFLKASIKGGTHPDFFVYPGHGHNVAGRDRVHLYEHITRYFDDFLK